MVVESGAYGEGATGRVSLRVIGIVETGFHDPESTPIQSQRDRDSSGRVRLEPGVRSGLEGIEGFDYVFLITFLDRPTPSRDDTDPWKVVPFLLADEARVIGAFATRHPARPNPIGLSLVRVTAVHDDGFDFAGVDLVDGTPVLDVKPWVPGFDTPQQPRSPVRTGWYAQGVLAREGVSPGDLRSRDA